MILHPHAEARGPPGPQRQDRAPQEVVAPAPQEQAPHAQGAPAIMSVAGCRSLALELRCLVWPGKFKPDLPPRYDGTTDPTEFLQLYELSIEASNDTEQVMANWFPMALKDGARSWLLNLPVGSISSWEELRECFVRNFQGTRDRAPTATDLWRVRL